MKAFAGLLLVAGLGLGAAPAAGEESEASPPLGIARHDAEEQQRFESSLLALDGLDRFRETHDALCAAPHPAGSEAQVDLGIQLAAWLGEAGTQVSIHRFDAYMPRFVDAEVALIDGDAEAELLPLGERKLEADPWSQDARLDIGWNAYSASATVTAPVVYCGFGTRQDFETLRALGVDVRGKIALIRYGRLFRGMKVRFAQEAGAAGVLLYSDPADTGPARGAPYPEGGWNNETSVQRGSILSLPYVGDPLTPGIPSTPDAPRLDVTAVDLPRIPSQPIGWANAKRIFERLGGEEVPEAWRGGLELAYRHGGDAPSTVRLRVEQDLARRAGRNIVGVVRGDAYPDEWIVVGCHYDAWTAGAGDPHAGTIVLLALARRFGQLAREGRRPRRSILFANWDAEEMGILGSTEWCEAHAEHLMRDCVAYLNLDMAAMGTRVRASAHPSLRAAVRSVVGDELRIGTMGGGSDHVPFQHHLGVPSMSLGAGGADGVSYHSAYDTPAWYRLAVGEGYAGARLLTDLGARLLARIANASVAPLDLRDVLGALEKLAEGLPENEAQARTRLTELAPEVESLQARLAERLAQGELEAGERARLRESLGAIRRLGWRARGLPGRSWYREALVGVDPDNGYGALALPPVDEAGGTHLPAATERFAAALRALADALD